MMVNIFLVLGSSKHKRKNRRKNEEAEIQPEKNFVCHLTGFGMRRFDCPSGCTMHPTSLCILLELEGYIPWTKHPSAPREQGEVMNKFMREVLAKG